MTTTEYTYHKTENLFNEIEKFIVDTTNKGEEDEQWNVAMTAITKKVSYYDDSLRSVEEVSKVCSNCKHLQTHLAGGQEMALPKCRILGSNSGIPDEDTSVAFARDYEDFSAIFTIKDPTSFGCTQFRKNNG